MNNEDKELSDLIFEAIIKNQEYKKKLFEAFINLDKNEFIKIFEENYIKSITESKDRVDIDNKIKINLLKEMLDYYLDRLSYQNNGMEIHHSHTYMKILSPYLSPPLFLLMLWRNKRSMMVENILDKEYIDVSPEFFDKCMKLFSQASDGEYDEKFYQKDDFFKLLFKHRLEKSLETKTHKKNNKI